MSGLPIRAFHNFENTNTMSSGGTDLNNIQSNSNFNSQVQSFQVQDDEKGDNISGSQYQPQNQEQNQTAPFRSSIRNGKLQSILQRNQQQKNSSNNLENDYQQTIQAQDRNSNHNIQEDNGFLQSDRVQKFDQTPNTDYGNGNRQDNRPKNQNSNLKRDEDENFDSDAVQMFSSSSNQRDSPKKVAKVQRFNADADDEDLSMKNNQQNSNSLQNQQQNTQFQSNNSNNPINGFQGSSGPVKTINLSKIKFLKNGTPTKNNNVKMFNSTNNGFNQSIQPQQDESLMNQSLTFTVKEVTDKQKMQQMRQSQNNGLGSTQKQAPSQRENSAFKYGRSQFIDTDNNADNAYGVGGNGPNNVMSPFKSLTTVNVVQNVVNYNMNANQVPPPHTQFQNQQKKFSHLMQSKQNVFNLTNQQKDKQFDQNQQQQPQKEDIDEDFQARLNYTINNAGLVDQMIGSNLSSLNNQQQQQQVYFSQQRNTNNNTDQPQQFQTEIQKDYNTTTTTIQKVNGGGGTTTTVVEECQVEVMNPDKLKQKLQNRRKQSNDNNSNRDNNSDYEYYSEDDDKEGAKNNNQQQKQRQQQQMTLNQKQQRQLVNQAEQNAQPQRLQQQQRQTLNPQEERKQGGNSPLNDFDDQNASQNTQPEDEEQKSPQLFNDRQAVAQDSRQNYREEDIQPMQSSRRLKEVNPGNKARANSTMNRVQRQQTNTMQQQQQQSQRQENTEQPPRQQLDQYGNPMVNQPTSNGDSEQSTQRFQQNKQLMQQQKKMRQAEKKPQGFDDCYKIKSIMEIASQQNLANQSEEDIDMLRIPGFPLAIRNHDNYIQYTNMLMYDVGGKSIMMQPIPFEVGMLQFEIQRKKSGFSVLHPSFHLYLEKGGDEKVSILYAKKRAFNKTANFLISTEKTKNKRGGDECLGKLRSNETKERYFLFNDGDNPKNMHKTAISGIRNEHMAIQYKYVPCSIGKLRKAKVIIPGVDPNTMKNREHKPLKKEDTMIKKIEDPQAAENFYVFVDNPPQWNPKTHGYHYDFRGRISEASVKNFQMIPYQDGQKGVNIRGMNVQFGRTNDNVFKLDAQYPFSIFQAFGLALTVFDCE